MKDENKITDLMIPDYSEELISIIKSHPSPEELRDKLSDYHDNDIAQVLCELTPDERKNLYKALGADAVSEIFSYLDDVELYIRELDDENAADIIGEMDADDAVDVLEDLSEEKQQAILDLMDSEAREDIELINSYDEDMIGNKMTTNYIVIRNDIPVKQAMKELIKQAAENDNVSTIFVTDADDRFCGAIDLRDLIILRDGHDLSEIIVTKYPVLHDKEKVSECLERLAEYSEDLVPVLDDDDKIVGTITASDVVEVMHEEMSEDYVKFAAITDSEDLREPLFKSVVKRLPWLLALLALGLVVSAILQGFQIHIPASLIILYTFQSLILDMSGNIGTQSLAVTIRVISGEVTMKEKLKLIFKELRVGTLNGLIVGSLAFGGIGVYLQFVNYGSIADLGVSGFLISGCIGLSVFIAMVIASLVGTFTPIIFKRIHVDPAAASGPLITTINDLVAICTYYGLSIALFVSILGMK